MEKLVFDGKTQEKINMCLKINPVQSGGIETGSLYVRWKKIKMKRLQHIKFQSNS